MRNTSGSMKLVPSVVRLVAPKAREKGLGLDARVADGLPGLYADRRALRQVLLNLFVECREVHACRRRGVGRGVAGNRMAAWRWR